MNLLNFWTYKQCNLKLMALWDMCTICLVGHAPDMNKFQRCTVDNFLSVQQMPYFGL